MTTAKTQIPVKSTGTMVFRNPSLVLDKWHDELRKEGGLEKTLLEEVTRGIGDYSSCERLRRNLQAAVGAKPGGKHWQMTTRGPLSIHLARSTGFENASLAFHPIHAVPYLPASGLKGLARSYAENCTGIGQATIDRIFGPRATRESDEENGLYAGSVVFLDALPANAASCRKVVVDILNSHHSKYYEGTGSHYEDTEDPIPVFFLSLAAKAEFEFFLHGRPGAPARDVEVAAEWLKQGLVLLGAGAKTNAGYGRFAGEAQPTESRLVQEFRLKLVSPAFLAGAQQSREDCNLRGASLRGILRWWWRIFMGGQLQLSELRKLEGLIWGTATQEGAVALVVEDQKIVGPEQWKKLPLGKTVQDTSRGYLAYGMEGNPRANKAPRFYLKPDSEWKLTLIGRNAQGDLSAQEALNHAAAALYLFHKYGGIGAKSRKGYGSMEVHPKPFSPELQQWMQERLKSSKVLNWPALRLRKEMPLVKLNTTSVEVALDKLAKAYRMLDKNSADYGLPRTGIRGKVLRCASPLHFKLVRGVDQQYYAGLVVLPTPSLNTRDNDLAAWQEKAPLVAVKKIEKALKEL